MTLLSIAQPAHETIRGVRFAMSDGVTLVTVLVAHAALQTIEWSPPGSGDYLARFKKHRDRLEQIASMGDDRARGWRRGALTADDAG